MSFTHAFQAKTMSWYRSVPCPRCHAWVGWACRTASGYLLYGTRVHQERKLALTRLIGVGDVTVHLVDGPDA